MKKLFKITALLAMSVFLISACSRNDDNNGEGTPDLPGGSNLTIQINGVSFKMIYVEGGTFDMGGTFEQGDDTYYDENPVHQVMLSSYYIGEFEVTQELWQAVTGENPSYFTPKNGYDNNLQRPVEHVSWDDIVNNFIPALNSLTGMTFALPTEAQWEFAARGGNESQHYKYSGGNNIDTVAWCESNSDYETHLVGQKQANELGIYDMSGNVWEWCNDWYGQKYYQYSPLKNPQGPFGFYRVNRGGSWDCNANTCRVSRRFYGPDYYSYIMSGFRLMLLP